VGEVSDQSWATQRGKQYAREQQNAVADSQALRAENARLLAERDEALREAGRLRELLIVSEGFRRAYSAARYHMFAMSEELRDLAVDIMPCSEGPLERVVRKAIGKEADEKLRAGYIEWAAMCDQKRPLAAAPPREPADAPHYCRECPKCHRNVVFAAYESHVEACRENVSLPQALENRVAAMPEHMRPTAGNLLRKIDAWHAEHPNVEFPDCEGEPADALIAEPGWPMYLAEQIVLHFREGIAHEVGVGNLPTAQQWVEDAIRAAITGGRA
jgi:hypothetical protein